MNALLPHLHEAAATQCDILAIQEVRICSEQVATVRAALKSYGYNLFLGALPQLKMQGQQRKSLHIDQLVPGVAFLIRDNIPVHEVVLESMGEWYDRGRFLSVKAFLCNRWVHLLCAYSPVQNGSPFLGDVSKTLEGMTHQDVILLGDLNQDAKEGAFVNDLFNYGWIPLTKSTDYEFTSYIHPKGVQSCIDTIVVTESVNEQVTPLQNWQILEKGHKLLYTTMRFVDKQKPTWEPFYRGKPEFDKDVSQQWKFALCDFKTDAAHTSIDDDWHRWCLTFQQLHNSSGSVLGEQPHFRLRDLFRKNLLLSRLTKAIFDSDWQSRASILHKIKQISHNQIRKWQKRINPRGQAVHDWARNLFRWAKDPQPPIPSCIASQDFGVQGFTTSLQDSLCEITQYFQQVYKSCEIDEAIFLADSSWISDDDLINDLFVTTKTVIAKSDPNRVPGLDGLEVSHLKRLPEEAILFLTHIFAKALFLHKVPKAWLNCKMSCIPKKPGKTSVKDLRPLSIAPVIYRVFCKVLLTTNADKQQNVPQHSVGGVLKRSSFQAWLPAALRCESTWKLTPDLRPMLQGVAIDTEKFFDNVPPEKATEALLAVGLPVCAVATWQYMITRIRRYASLNGAVHTQHFGATSGIPQGDPLSMLAAAALLGQWTLEIPSDNVFAKVFVDDRLLLSGCGESLLQAFHATELWDSRIGFRTRAKTRAFGNNCEDDNIWWMDATEVDRSKLVTYLGVPLPFKGISATSFFEPIMQKALTTLTRICRAKLTHENAAAIVARKILPAICYPATVVRPSRVQIDHLRSRIFAATAYRPCQTLDAHVLLCEKTHQFDPQCALVYHNLRFWRRVFLDQPALRDEFLHLYNDALPIKQYLYGPINIFQKDIEWIGCTFLPCAGIIQHPTLGQVSLFDPDKSNFEHHIPSILRAKLAANLEAKHVKWQGISDIDIDASTSLLREMEPSCPIRVPLIRLLSDAHATQHRLHKMGVVATPHCPLCLHEDAHIMHIIWDCPRFDELRRDWPPALCKKVNWPNCALNSLICTQKLPLDIRKSWPLFQQYVAKLLFQWMEMQRSADMFDTYISCADAGPARQHSEPPAQFSRNWQQARCAGIPLLPLQWKPLTTRTAINLWGATLKDFNLLFTFWAKATMHDVHRFTPVTTWTHTLAIFLQVGGHAAPFLTRCPNIAMAAFKFRTLSAHLLKAQSSIEGISALFESENRTAKWLSAFPREVAFPPELRFAFNWDLREAASNIQALFLNLRADFKISAQAIRLGTADFVQAIPKLTCFLREDSLSASWPTPRFPCKALVPPWVTLVHRMRVSPERSLIPISCVTQLSLEQWLLMSPADVKAKIPGQPGVRKRFIAAQNRFKRFKAALDNCWQMQLLGNSFRTHIVAPLWQDNEPCHFCGKLIHFSARPRNLSLRCPTRAEISPSLFEKWQHDFQMIDDMIGRIIRLL